MPAMIFRFASAVRRPARRIALQAARAGAGIAAALSVLCLAGAADAACRLEGFAVAAVTMVGMRPIVHATLNGEDALFLVDTGAFASALSPSAAARHHIRVFSRGGVDVEGIGGSALAQTAQVEYLQFGGAAFYDTPFLVVGGLGRDVDGVLGQDILGRTDAEYDFANGLIRLIRPKGCGGSDVLSYWTDRPNVLGAPATLPFARAISAEGEINGQKVRVGLDSGSPYSDMTLKAAARAGVTPSSPDVSPAQATTGLAGRPSPTWSAPFERFALGTEAVLHTRLRITQTDLGGADLLLGADFFLAHRLYVSRLQRRLYYTYNGGPVFRLRETPTVAWSFKDAPQGAVQGDPNAPVDAAGFGRRGAASVARGDLKGAVDDFSRAIALEPKMAVFYFDRGAAHALDGRGDLALADFDAGLALEPANASALLARASLQVDAALDDPAREDAARADLQAAARLAPDDPVVGLEIAGLYERAALFPEAIAAYDGWTARHGRDDLLPQALAGRCRARALSRTQFDLAGKDCEAALRARRADGGLLASRGLLHLARGETDLAIADADAALKTGERPFWALEARGLAELDKGLEDRARADLAAAAAIDARQAERARKLGLTAPFNPLAAAAR